MTPTEKLMEEHRLIERVLDCLISLVNEAEGGAPFAVMEAAAALDFIQEFADKRHHGKEEDHLFRLLEARGMGGGGPVQVMRHEHDIGRACVRAMRDSLKAAGQGEVKARETFASAAREFVALLRDHIAKEDGVLYVMANRLLDSQDQAALALAFENVDASDIGARGPEIAARLGARFQVAVGTRHQFSCGHT